LSFHTLTKPTGIFVLPMASGTMYGASTVYANGVSWLDPCVFSCVVSTIGVSGVKSVRNSIKSTSIVFNLFIVTPISNSLIYCFELLSLLVFEIKVKRALLTGLIVVAVLLVVFVFMGVIDHSNVSQSQSNTTRSVLVIDGLSVIEPSDFFVENTRELFLKAGYSVDVVRGENVSVNYLLGIGRYDIIVLRLHSSISIDGELFLFTGELYNEFDYLGLRVLGVVGIGDLREEGKKFFALSARFWVDRIGDRLANSIIVLMGCDGSRDSVFIDKLVEKGVLAYIAWNGPVTIEHSDTAILLFLRKLLYENIDVCSAVVETMGEVGADPYYGGKLECFTRG